MGWNLSGRYAETCNCDFLCPCGPSGLSKSTNGTCTFVMGFEVDKGEHDGTSLAGRKLLMIARSPGEMIAGNWEVGLIVDDGADAAQRDALVAIMSGQAGGPFAGLAPLIGKFLGVESATVTFQGSGKDWAFSAGKYADHVVEGAMGLGGEQMYLDGVGHPVNNRLALGRAKKSQLHAFGIDWEQSDGKNNGHFAPFEWRV